MGATEMTTTAANRLTRLAAIVAGLAAALMLLAGMQAKSADAAYVANPGTFTVSFANGSGDGIRFSNGSINETRWPFSAITNPSPPSFPITVNADGTFTADTGGVSFQEKQIHNNCLTGAFLCLSAPKGVKSLPEVGGTWNGTIDPAAGLVTMNLPLRIRNRTVSGTAIDDCYIGGAGTGPIDVSASSSNANGSAYNFLTGTTRLADAGWTTPMPGGLNGGGGSSDCDRTANWNTPMNLPSADTWFRANMTIKDANGDGVRPFPKPTFTVSPNPVGEGDTVTLDASASNMTGYLDACPDPDVDTGCGYEWDFDNDGTVDERTNTPTVTTSYASAGSYTAKLTINSNMGTIESTTRTVTAQIHPVAQIDTTPPAVTKETVNAFEFSIPVNPDSATNQCSIDGGSWSACITGDEFTFTQADDTIGSHNFRVRGITPGGVTGPPASHDFTIDRVKPRVTIDAKPNNPTNSTSANFTFDADKPNSTLECQLDGGSWQPCGTNSTGSQGYTGLSESSPRPIEAPNPHEFRVRATDQYGNVGGDGNPGGGGFDWEIDLTAPQINLDTKPANPSNEVDPVFGWVNNESIQLAQCRLGINGTQGAWANCGSLNTKSYEDVADGTYSFGVRTLDIAGNWSNVTTWNWVLETIDPGLTITKVPPLFSSRSMAQFFFDTDEENTIRCQLDSEPVQDPCASGVKYEYMSEGSHIFSVTSTDPALNETTKTYSWSVKTVQPVVAIDQSSQPDAASTVDTADFVLTTANGTAECSLDGASWSECDSDSGQSYTGLGQGNHTFEVRAVDEFGNKSATDAYSWIVLTTAPEVSITSKPPARDKHTTATFGLDIESADANVAPVCTIDGLEFGCSNPAVASGLADGDHTFEVSATDSAGQTDGDSYTWTVKAKIPGLGFDSTPAGLSNSSSATFEFSSDEDPDVNYECSQNGATWADCATPVELTGLSEGSHSFRVRATDDVDNEIVESYSWKVDTVAPVIVFDEIPPASTDDVAELIRFNASEPDAGMVCKLDGGAFAACTSPSLVKNLSIGNHTFTVKGTDAAGNEGPEASFSWTVTAAPVPPVAVGQKGKVTTQSADTAEVTTQNGDKAEVAAKKAKAKKSKAKAKKSKAKAKAKAKKAKKAKAKAKKKRAKKAAKRKNR